MLKLIKAKLRRIPFNEIFDDVWSGYSGSIPGTVPPRLEWKIEKIS
jgi:hypothetical protein